MPTASDRDRELGRSREPDRDEDRGRGRDPDSDRGPRAPRDYRPDLRPLFVLVGLLVLVVVAWTLLGPLILPGT